MDAVPAAATAHEVFENQRFYAAFGWGAPLKVLDWPAWSTAAGEAVVVEPPPQEGSDWELVYGPHTDHEGWIYGTAFARLQHQRVGGRACKRATDVARTRLWVRKGVGPQVRAVEGPRSARSRWKRDFATRRSATKAHAVAFREAFSALLDVLKEATRRRQVPDLALLDPGAMLTIMSQHGKLLQQQQSSQVQTGMLTQRHITDDPVPCDKGFDSFLARSADTGQQMQPALSAVSRSTLEELLCCVRHARAAYGYVMQQGHLASIQRFAAMQVQAPYFDAIGGASFEAHNHAVQELLGISDDDILLAEWSSAVFRPCHFVSVNHQHRCIILAIRGSLQWGDVCTDVTADAVDLELGGVSGKVHEGILSAAAYVHSNTVEVLQDAATHYPDWPLLVTGHSLGAGVASVLAVILQHQEAKPLGLGPVRCYAIAPPSVMTAELAEQASRFTISLVVGADVVPRLSLHSVEKLLLEIKKTSWVTKVVSTWTSAISQRKATSDPQAAQDTSAAAPGTASQPSHQSDTPQGLQAVLDSKADDVEVAKQLATGAVESMQRAATDATQPCQTTTDAPLSQQPSLDNKKSCCEMLGSTFLQQTLADGPGSLASDAAPATCVSVDENAAPALQAPGVALLGPGPAAGTTAFDTSTQAQQPGSPQIWSPGQTHVVPVGMKHKADTGSTAISVRAVGGAVPDPPVTPDAASSDEDEGSSDDMDFDEWIHLSDKEWLLNSLGQITQDKFSKSPTRSGALHGRGPDSHSSLPSGAQAHKDGAACSNVSPAGKESLTFREGGGPGAVAGAQQDGPKGSDGGAAGILAGWSSFFESKGLTPMWSGDPATSGSQSSEAAGSSSVTAKKLSVPLSFGRRAMSTAPGVEPGLELKELDSSNTALSRQQAAVNTSMVDALNAGGAARGVRDQTAHCSKHETTSNGGSQGTLQGGEQRPLPGVAWRAQGGLCSHPLPGLAGTVSNAVAVGSRGHSTDEWAVVQNASNSATHESGAAERAVDLGSQQFPQAATAGGFDAAQSATTSSHVQSNSSASQAVQSNSSASQAVQSNSSASQAVQSNSSASQAAQSNSSASQAVQLDSSTAAAAVDKQQCTAASSLADAGASGGAAQGLGDLPPVLSQEATSTVPLLQQAVADIPSTPPAANLLPLYPPGLVLWLLPGTLRPKPGGTGPAGDAGAVPADTSVPSRFSASPLTASDAPPTAPGTSSLSSTVPPTSSLSPSYLQPPSTSPPATAPGTSSLSPTPPHPPSTSSVAGHLNTSATSTPTPMPTSTPTPTTKECGPPSSSEKDLGLAMQLPSVRIPWPSTAATSGPSNIFRQWVSNASPPSGVSSFLTPSWLRLGSNSQSQPTAVSTDLPPSDTHSALSHASINSASNPDPNSTTGTNCVAHPIAFDAARTDSLGASLARTELNTPTAASTAAESKPQPRGDTHATAVMGMKQTSKAPGTVSCAGVDEAFNSLPSFKDNLTSNLHNLPNRTFTSSTHVSASNSQQDGHPRESHAVGVQHREPGSSSSFSFHGSDAVSSCSESEHLALESGPHTGPAPHQLPAGQQTGGSKHASLHVHALMALAAQRMRGRANRHAQDQATSQQTTEACSDPTESRAHSTSAACTTDGGLPGGFGEAVGRNSEEVGGSDVGQGVITQVGQELQHEPSADHAGSFTAAAANTMIEGHTDMDKQGSNASHTDHAAQDVNATSAGGSDINRVSVPSGAVPVATPAAHTAVCAEAGGDVGGSAATAAGSATQDMHVSRTNSPSNHASTRHTTSRDGVSVVSTITAVPVTGEDTKTPPTQVLVPVSTCREEQAGQAGVGVRVLTTAVQAAANSIGAVSREHGTSATAEEDFQDDGESAAHDGFSTNATSCGAATVAVVQGQESLPACEEAGGIDGVPAGVWAVPVMDSTATLQALPRLRQDPATTAHTNSHQHAAASPAGHAASIAGQEMDAPVTTQQQPGTKADVMKPSNKGPAGLMGEPAPASPPQGSTADVREPLDPPAGPETVCALQAAELVAPATFPAGSPSNNTAEQSFSTTGQATSTVCTQPSAGAVASSVPPLEPTISSQPTLQSHMSVATVETGPVQLADHDTPHAAPSIPGVSVTAIATQPAATVASLPADSPLTSAAKLAGLFSSKLQQQQQQMSESLQRLKSNLGVMLSPAPPPPPPALVLADRLCFEDLYVTSAGLNDHLPDAYLDGLQKAMQELGILEAPTSTST